MTDSTHLQNVILYALLPAMTFVAMEQMTGSVQAGMAAAGTHLAITGALKYSEPETRERFFTTAANITIVTSFAAAVGTLTFLGTDRIEYAVLSGFAGGTGFYLAWSYEPEDPFLQPDSDRPDDLVTRLQYLKGQADKISQNNVSTIYARLLDVEQRLASFRGADARTLQKAEELVNTLRVQITSYVRDHNELLRMQADGADDDLMRVELAMRFHIVKVADDGNCAPRAAAVLASEVYKPILEQYFSGDEVGALVLLRGLLTKHLDELRAQRKRIGEANGDASIIFKEANKHDGSILPMLEWNRLRPLLGEKPDVSVVQNTLKIMEGKLDQLIARGEKALTKGWNEALNCLLTGDVIRLRKEMQKHICHGMELDNGQKEDLQFLIYASLTGAQEAVDTPMVSRRFKAEVRAGNGWLPDLEHYLSPLSHWDNADKETGAHWFGEPELHFMAQVLGVDIGVYNGKPVLKNEKELVLNDNYVYPCGKADAECIYFWNARGENHYYALLPKPHQDL